MVPSEIFFCLPDAERMHLLPVSVDEIAYPFRVGLGVIPQTPADSFVDKKLRAAEIIDKNPLEQSNIRGTLPAELMIDGDSAHPEVLIFRPPQHQIINSAIRERDIANHPVQPVDCVPPLL